MRFLLLLALPLLLTACYRPVYGDKSMGMDETAQENRLNHIALAGIANEEGQVLRNFLIDRMYGKGRPADTTATLEIGITKVEEDLGLQRDATTVRKRLTYTANYTLTDNTTRKVLTSDFVRSLVSYDKIDAQYGALISKEAAGKRAMKEIADQIILRLLLPYTSDTKNAVP